MCIGHLVSDQLSRSAWDWGVAQDTGLSVLKLAKSQGNGMSRSHQCELRAMWISSLLPSLSLVSVLPFTPGLMSALPHASLINKSIMFENNYTLRIYCISKVLTMGNFPLGFKNYTNMNSHQACLNHSTVKMYHRSWAHCEGWLFWTKSSNGAGELNG